MGSKCYTAIKDKTLLYMALFSQGLTLLSTSFSGVWAKAAIFLATAEDISLVVEFCPDAIWLYI